MGNIMTLLNNDYFSILPDSAILIILNNLSIPELANTSLMNSRIHSLALNVMEQKLLAKVPDANFENKSVSEKMKSIGESMQTNANLAKVKTAQARKTQNVAQQQKILENTNPKEFQNAFLELKKLQEDVFKKLNISFK